MRFKPSEEMRQEVAKGLSQDSSHGDGGSKGGFKADSEIKLGEPFGRGEGEDSRVL